MPDIDDNHRRTVNSVVLFLNNWVIKLLFLGYLGTVKQYSSVEEKIWETVALGFRRTSPLTRDKSLTASLVVMKYVYTINK